MLIIFEKDSLKKRKESNFLKYEEINSSIQF